MSYTTTAEMLIREFRELRCHPRSRPLERGFRIRRSLQLQGHLLFCEACLASKPRRAAFLSYQVSVIPAANELTPSYSPAHQFVLDRK